MATCITDHQASVNLYHEKGRYRFFHEGKEYQKDSLEKVHRFFQKQTEFDTVKLCEKDKKSYVHFLLDDVEIYETKKSLRRALCQEGGGTSQKYTVRESGTSLKKRDG